MYRDFAGEPGMEFCLGIMHMKGPSRPEGIFWHGLQKYVVVEKWKERLKRKKYPYIHF